MPQKNVSAAQQIQARQRQDFHLWLQRIPRDFLQALYRMYLVQGKAENLRRDGISPNIVKEKETILPSTKVEKKVPFAILRRSIFYLIITLIAIELFFDLLFLGLRFALMIVVLPSDIAKTVTYLSFSVFSSYSVLKAIFMLYLAIRWVTTRYELYDGEVRFKHGIVLKQEKIYMCTYTQEVVTSQGFLGRIFNFGTIELYNPVLKESVYIDSIPNPTKYTEMIKNGLPDQAEGLVPL